MNFTTIIEKKQLKPSSIKTYTANHKVLLKHLKIDEITEEWIDNNTEVLQEKLLDNKEFTYSKKRNLLNVILLFLNKGTPIYTKYFNIIKKLNDEYKQITNKGEYSKKEAEKLIPYEEMKSKVEEDIMKMCCKFKTLKSLKSITESEYNDLKNLVIQSLYILHPPRRTDYVDMKLCLETEKCDDENNVLVYTKFKKPIHFIFRKDLVKSTTEGDEIVEISSPPLRSLLKMWIYLCVYKKQEYVFVNDKGKKMSKNNFTQLVKRAFEKSFNKKINISLLRKIYITKEYKKNDIVELARQMNHSVGVASSVYNKKNDNIKLEIKEIEK